jgi:hypothetical protein
MALSTAERQRIEPTLPSAEEREALELRAWQTVAATGDLQSVVNAVAELSAPALDFQAFGVNTFQPDKGFRLVAAWNGGGHCAMLFSSFLSLLA